MGDKEIGDFWGTLGESKTILKNLGNNPSFYEPKWTEKKRKLKGLYKQIKSEINFSSEELHELDSLMKILFDSSGMSSEKFKILEKILDERFDINLKDAISNSSAVSLPQRDKILDMLKKSHFKETYEHASKCFENEFNEAAVSMISRAMEGYLSEIYLKTENKKSLRQEREFKCKKCGYIETKKMYMSLNNLLEWASSTFDLHSDIKEIKRNCMLRAISTHGKFQTITPENAKELNDDFLKILEAIEGVKK